MSYLEATVETPSQASGVRQVGQHPAMRRVFGAQGLTVGLILPLETHPNAPRPTMQDHLQMARRADELGFASLWLRDVPFYDPSYGDVAQVFEPMVYLATLAAATRQIALGTAGLVLPLREPKILAKQATSIDQLSGGRMLTGLSSGDRPAEYPLFGIDFETRGERFRDAFEVFRKVSEDSFPTFESARFGRAMATHDLVPKPKFGALPTLAIGRGQQTTAWLAAHMDGLIVPTPATGDFDALVSDWRSHVAEQCGEGASKPIGVAGFLDLVDDRSYPFKRLRGGFRTGVDALAEVLQQAAQAGVSHIALNPKISRRPYAEVMDELAERLLPFVPASA